MVVVSVRKQGTQRTLRFERTFTLGTTRDCELFLGASHQLVEITIAIADPDVRLELDQRVAGLMLNDFPVDPDFVHVLHVGDKLRVENHEIVFELVAGSLPEVQRALGEVSTAPDDAELEVLEALRSDFADPVAREVYADWLDGAGRGCEAELVRLQWLPDANRVTDPQAFSSEWMSHQPRAIQVRLRDLALLSDPARRALSSRPAMLCRAAGCMRQWEALAVVPGTDTVRHCRACGQDVPFCSTYHQVADRGFDHLPVAIDPILALEAADQIYYAPSREFDEPTNPRIPLDDDDEEL